MTPSLSARTKGHRDRIAPPQKTPQVDFSFFTSPSCRAESQLASRPKFRPASTESLDRFHSDVNLGERALETGGGVGIPGMRPEMGLLAVEGGLEEAGDDSELAFLC